MDMGRISRVSDSPVRKRLISKFSGTRKSHNSIFSYTNIGVLICVYIICAGDLCHSVVGQEATLTSDTSDHFNKSTACVCGVDRVPCAKSLTSSDCPNGRVISRRDCPCCFVCAKQLTDECNNEELLCDADYGLECGSDKHCKAKTQCSDDTSCLNDQMCVGGACADACKVLPDVCKETNMTNGICVARNHRALCTCSPGTTLNSEKVCSAAEAEVIEGKKCEIETRQINSGETTFTHKCQKSCKCETSGELSCQDSPTTPVCQKDFIPMSNITGEMSDACKILIGNDALFDGCCVPQQCQVIKPQDHTHHSTVGDDVKGGRDFKLTESHNNLGEDDKSKLKIESTKDGGDGSSSSSSSAAFLNNELLKTETKEADGPGSMQVTVLKRSDHSAVIKLPKNDKEAILSIALSNELAQRPGSDGVWKEHRIPPGLPQITLSTLLPNTSYTLKYAVDAKEYPSVQFITDASPQNPSSSTENTSNESSELSAETEMDAAHPTSSSSTEQEVAAAPTIIPVSAVGVTEIETTVHPVSSVGCLYNGTSYELGEIFHIGCDERCECLKNGEVKCMERCSIPLFKKGAFSHDKMCFEEPSGVDDCCVLIACARAHPHGRTEESGREIVAIIPQPCDSVKCGPNAHCLGPATGLLSDEEQQTNQTLCVCNEGQIGDPYDEVHGCQSGVTPTSATEVSSSSTSTSLPTTPTSTSTQKVDGCVFKNKTYTYGEEHFDDCSYKCRCETSGEFLCVPRCNYRRDEEKEIPLGCEIKKDPSDLECCEMLVCQGEPLQSGSRKDSPTVPTDGCLYKNTTYAKDEKFYDGCIQQCMCFSNGDVTCQPRCPPAATNSSGDDCVTLPDPSDKCCMVTVCGNSTLSDVMKDATTTAATLMDYSTTIVPAQGEGRSSVSEAPTVRPSYSLRISLIHPLNESTIMVAVRISDAELSVLADESITIQYSTDTKLWKNVTSKVKDAIKTARSEITLPVSNLDRNTEYHFKANIGNVESNIAAGFTKFDDSLGSLEDGEFLSSEFGESPEEMDATTEDDPASITPAEKLPCMHKDKSYAFGEEFFDTCEAYCTCQRGGKMKCVEIDCPVDGLDLLDDSCVKWEPDPKFKKEPPNCCSQMRCVQHSSCMVEGGIMIRNFDEIPQKITGCDKRCYCEFGNVTCQSLCPVMTDQPPANLPCPKQFAAVMTMPENECCYQWSCRMPQIPQHHLHNLSELNGSKNALVPSSETLNKTAAVPPTPIRHDANANTTQLNNGPTAPNFPLHPPPNLPSQHDPHQRPSTAGNQPTLVHLDKINPHQIQELLHHLATLGEDGGLPSDQIHGGGVDREPQPPPPSSNTGTFVQVQTAHQVRELEKELGAKFVERAEDGSYIVLIPNSELGDDDDQNYPDQVGQFPPHGQGPPPHFSHAPPSRFPGQGGHQFPFGLNPFQQGPPHGMHRDRTKVANIVIHPLNESTLQIDFTVSPILVGLQGHVEVLYTSEFEHKSNPAQWERKVFQQAEDLIDNTHLQLFLTNLKPDTEYHVQIKVVVVQSDIGSTSDIMIARTPPIPIPTTTLPPEIIVDPEVQLRSTASNSITLHWRKFTDFEKNLVDGVQIAYKASDDKVYSTTPLIHRSLSEFELENLQPDKGE
ncbi:putative epidermal cell surface receptor [Folsomia candida]|uniref:Putative epidermal cell surface receptor n=1 Tax=Folsomia candida TaxID=158441 RepID=A0A226ET48_FOLCA|nr:putative epidermal cell surface receptor [Folsomia candida]